jgi:hypothetical protein
MCFFFSLIPATFWATIGYFVLFSSTKAEGTIQKIGKILSYWIFFLAYFSWHCALFSAAHMQRSRDSVR